MTEDHIRLIVPEVGRAELEGVAAVLESGYLTQGPVVAAFEASVASYVKASHAIATTSATTALHLALAALGVGPGDEVIVPDFTFPATANVVVQLGARPVLVDVDLQTFNVDPDAVMRATGPRTRAIMPVHAFGLMAPIEAVIELARDQGIPVVEDAACALGATRGEAMAGTSGTAGCFSFHPRKAITTGEGGMIVTDDDQLAERARAMRTHGGRRVEGRFAFDDVGFNYRLSDILAAIGLAQMDRLDAIIAGRRERAARYDELLDGVDGVSRPASTPGHIYQSYVVMLNSNIDRDTVIKQIAEANIETTLGTYAVHAQPSMMRRFGYQPGDLPNSYRAYLSSLTLPLHNGMTDADLIRVVGALKASLRT